VLIALGRDCLGDLLLLVAAVCFPRAAEAVANALATSIGLTLGYGCDQDRASEEGAGQWGIAKDARGLKLWELQTPPER
jgi:hypothetical protein